MEWIRIAFEINQENANDGASVLLESLKIIYRHTYTLSTESGFEDSLREFVAKNIQSNSQAITQLEVPVTTYSDSGGRLLLSNLTVVTEPGYYSTFNLSNPSLGLYPNGQIYEIITTHTVEQATGTTLSQGRLRLVTDDVTFYMTYNDSLGSFQKVGDDINRLTLLPSSYSTNYGNNGGKQLVWRILSSMALK